MTYTDRMQSGQITLWDGQWNHIASRSYQAGTVAEAMTGFLEEHLGDRIVANIAIDLAVDGHPVRWSGKIVRHPEPGMR